MALISRLFHSGKHQRTVPWRPTAVLILLISCLHTSARSRYRSLTDRKACAISLLMSAHSGQGAWMKAVQREGTTERKRSFEI